MMDAGDQAWQTLFITNLRANSSYCAHLYVTIKANEAEATDVVGQLPEALYFIRIIRKQRDQSILFKRIILQQHLIRMDNLLRILLISAFVWVH